MIVNKQNCSNGSYKNMRIVAQETSKARETISHCSCLGSPIKAQEGNSYAFELCLNA